MVRYIPYWSWVMLLMVSISGCDNSSSQPSNGTSGTPSANDLAQGQQIGNAVSGTQPVTNAGGGAGFGSPQDVSQFGTAAFSASSIAKIDTDGDPSEQGYRPELERADIRAYRWSTGKLRRIRLRGDVTGTDGSERCPNRRLGASD